MKKIILFLSWVFTNFMFAQQSVSISGPSNVEVGVPYNYTFTFSPVYPSLNGVQADSYIITEWVVLTGTNGQGASIPGYINSPTNQSSYYNDSTYNSSNPKTIPIQWGDGTFLSSDNITVKVSGIYRKSSTGENIGYFNYLQKTLTVTVERLKVPAISGLSSVLNCNQTNVTYSVSNQTNATQFQWSTTGGAVIVGTSTNTSVTVTPPITGNYFVSCTVKRSGGNPNYNLTSNFSVSRISRTVSFTALYPEHPNNSQPIDYICKGGIGRQMSIPSQSDITNINWVAVGCSITGQNTLNPTITPLNTTTTGSSFNVYAIVTFTGGCTATTPIRTFRVLDSVNPTLPTGYLKATKTGNTLCTSETLDVSFVTTNGFNNGIVTVSPDFIWGPASGRQSINKKITVYNRNLCTGIISCKDYFISSPPPCSLLRNNNSNMIIISPNPANDNVNVKLPEILSGSYQIFEESSATLIQEGKFDKQAELKIEFSAKIKSGIYILNVITENNGFSEKIIIKN